MAWPIRKKEKRKSRAFNQQEKNKNKLIFSFLRTLHGDMVADPEGLLNMNINIHAYDKFAQAWTHGYLDAWG